MPTEQELAERTSAALLAQAARLARARRFDESDALLKRVLALSEDVNAQVLLAKLRAQRGDLAGAQSALASALARSPNHVAALAASRSLQAGAITKRRWALGAFGLATAALAAWLGAAVLHSGEVSRPPMPSAERSATARTTSIPEHTTRMRQYKEFAAMAAELSNLRGAGVVRAEPVNDQERLKVRVIGAVPTEHVRNKVLAQMARHDHIEVDATGLLVDHRYVVRKGDTLVAIATQAYGDRASWKKLWLQNKQAVPAPERLATGTVLTFP